MKSTLKTLKLILFLLAVAGILSLGPYSQHTRSIVGMQSYIPKGYLCFFLVLHHKARLLAYWSRSPISGMILWRGCRKTSDFFQQLSDLTANPIMLSLICAFSHGWRYECGSLKSFSKCWGFLNENCWATSSCGWMKWY